MADDKFKPTMDVSDFDDFQPTMDVSDFDNFQPSQEESTSMSEPIVGAAIGGTIGKTAQLGTELADKLMTDRLVQAAIGMDTTKTGREIKAESFDQLTSPYENKTGLFDKKDVIKTAKEMSLTDSIGRGKDAKKQMQELAKRKDEILKTVEGNKITGLQVKEQMIDDILSSIPEGSEQRAAALKEYDKIMSERIKPFKQYTPKEIEDIKDSIKFENVTMAEKAAVAEGRNVSKQAERRILRGQVEDTITDPDLLKEFTDIKSKQGQLKNIVDMAREGVEGSGKLVPETGLKSLINKYYEKSAGLGARTLQGAAKVGKALPVIGAGIGALIGAGTSEAGEEGRGAVEGAIESAIPFGLDAGNLGPERGSQQAMIESGKMKVGEYKPEPIDNTNYVEKKLDLDSKSNLKALIDQFNQLSAKNPNYENYVSKLQEIEQSGSEKEKSQMEFNLLQQPAFRQFLKNRDSQK